MKRSPALWIIVIIAFAAAGCASHYHREGDGRLMLYLKMPEAKSVLFACSLDRFTPRKTALRNSFWEVDVPAGRSFSYFYIVDGEIYTPPCSQKERDDFGSLNCLYTGQ